MTSTPRHSEAAFETMIQAHLLRDGYVRARDLRDELRCQREPPIPSGRATVTDVPPKEGESILYQTANDAVGMDVRTVNEHVRNVYESGELSEEATLRKIRTVQREQAHIPEGV